MPNCQELFLKLIIKLYESQKNKSFRFDKYKKDVLGKWDDGVWSFGFLKKKGW